MGGKKVYNHKWKHECYGSQDNMPEIPFASTFYIIPMQPLIQWGNKQSLVPRLRCSHLMRAVGEEIIAKTVLRVRLQKGRVVDLGCM